MKTLKHLAILALVCCGSAAMAMGSKEFWILNKSSYEITVIPKGLARTQEKIAAGQASSFTAKAYEIQSKYANGVINILNDTQAEYAKLDKAGKPSGTKTLDISNNKNVFVVDVGKTTGFTVATMTSADAKNKYPKSGLIAIAIITPEQIDQMIKSGKPNAALLKQLQSNLTSQLNALSNIQFAREHGIPYTLVPLDKGLTTKLTKDQILKLTNAELYRIYGFDTEPNDDALIAYARFDMKKREQLVRDTLVGDKPDMKQLLLKAILLKFEIFVLMPSIEAAIDRYTSK